MISDENKSIIQILTREYNLSIYRFKGRNFIQIIAIEIFNLI
jgi:hypothetical protein